MKKLNSGGVTTLEVVISFLVVALIGFLLWRAFVVQETNVDPNPLSERPTAWAPPSWIQPGLTWQYQLSGKVNTKIAADVFDIDYQTDPSTVGELQQKGARAICYVSVGSVEDFRPDAEQYPDSIIGKSNGWPGEKWLDIRAIDQLEPIISARFDTCQQSGFDAIEADNVDGYTHDSGFDLTSDDQLLFNKKIAQMAHDRGLAIGLKNDIDQLESLRPYFDFAINEQCVEFDECKDYKAWIEHGKPVFHVEYNASKKQVCNAAEDYGLSSIIKNVDLGPKIIKSCV